MVTMAVIGGGMVGIACARHLQRSGFDVTVFDEGQSRRAASYGNAGHIATEQVTPLSTRRTLASAPQRLFGLGGALDFRLKDVTILVPWVLQYLKACQPDTAAKGQLALADLLQHALPGWQRLMADLGADDLLKPEGHVTLWTNPRTALRKFEAALTAPMGTARAHALGPDELARYGELTKLKPVMGLRYTGTGQIDTPQRVRECLLAAFKADGGEVLSQAVTDMVVGSRIEIATARALARPFDHALIAAGAWSHRLMAMVGQTIPLIGERGYMVQSADHQWPGDQPPTVFDDISLITTRFSTGLRASSHLEFGDPDAVADPRKWAMIDQHIATLGLPFGPSRDYWMGPRPTLPDYLPAIGRLKGHSNVFYAFGHQHLGITLAAITGELIADLCSDKALPCDINAFSVERFF